MSWQPENAPKLTRKQLSQARVIARGKKIRAIERLMVEYGGDGKGWVKKSSQPFYWDDHLVEIHWYEHQAIGRFEEKVKQLD
jgi:hypothetical protein